MANLEKALKAVAREYHKPNFNAKAMMQAGFRAYHDAEAKPAPAPKLEAGCMVKTPKDGEGTVVAIACDNFIGRDLVWVMHKFVSGREWLDDKDNTCLNGKIYPATEIKVTKPATPEVGDLVEDDRHGQCLLRYHDPEVWYAITPGGACVSVLSGEYTILRKAKGT